MLLWKSLPYSHVSLFAGGTLVLWRRKTQEIASSSACIVPARYLWNQSDYCCATRYFFIFLATLTLTFLYDFVVYTASSLWRCYNETSRGLHTAATWARNFFFLYHELRWSSVKIDKNTKRSCYCFCSYSILLIIVNLLRAMMTEWLNKTIQTTSCRWLTCKRQQPFRIIIDNNR